MSSFTNTSMVKSKVKANTKPLIMESMIEMHTKLGYPIFPNDALESTFGILEIKTLPVPMTETPIFFLFSFDYTLSMNKAESDKPDSLTKLDYLIQTFTKMLHYFINHTSDAVIYIQVNAFNEKVETIIPEIRVKEHHIADMVQDIKNYKATGCTNIGLAMKEARECIQTHAIIHPDHEICHIFITDGEQNKGVLPAETLCDMIHPKFATIFFGIGSCHNTKLLQQLGKQPLCEYHFINNMEYSGIVCGETIHRFLYPALKDVRIVMQYGEIYDWQTNRWLNRLHEPLISGDTNRTYHVRSTDPKNEISADIYAIGRSNSVIMDTAIMLPPLMNPTTRELNPVDLSKYIFRQKTMEALYDISEYEMVYCIDEKLTDIYDTLNTYYDTLNRLFKKMRLYMQEHGLLNDPFMIKLCDDISVVYQMMDTNDGSKYIAARQCSQGRERSYNTTIRELTSDNDTLSDSDSDLDEDLVRRKHSASTIVYTLDAYMPSDSPMYTNSSPSLTNTLSQL